VDSRNSETTSSVVEKFAVDFTTCTLTVTDPPDQKYVLGSS